MSNQINMSMNMNMNDETRIFNTFVSNESQILESLKMIQHNQEELNQIMNQVEGIVPGFEQGEINRKKSQADIKQKKKIVKSALETFIEDQNDFVTDVEMLQDEKKASPIVRSLSSSKMNISWKELTSLWNQHQNLVVL